MIAAPRPALATLLLLAACPRPAYDYPDGRGIEGQLEREIVALQQRLRTLEDEARTCRDGTRTDAVYAELHQVLSGNDVELSHQGVVTIVSMPEAHLFGSDGASIRDEARVTLDLLATVLNKHGKHLVVVEGHTADVAPSAQLARRYPSLVDLSYSRAASIVRVLVDRFGVREERFTIAARGPHAPVASNDTPAGQALNRRIVVYIYPPGVLR